MKRNGSDLPFYVAVHEAGHAIAHWYSGSSFNVARVRTRSEIASGRRLDKLHLAANDVAGSITGPRRYTSSETIGEQSSKSADGPTPGRLSTMRANAEIEILHDLAGPIAEARYRRTAIVPLLIRGAASDYEHARRMAAEFADDAAEIAAAIAAGAAAARKMLQGHGVWAATLEIARELHRRRRITYKQVCRIAGKHTGTGLRPSDVLLRKAEASPG